MTVVDIFTVLNPTDPTTAGVTFGKMIARDYASGADQSPSVRATIIEAAGRMVDAMADMMLALGYEDADMEVFRASAKTNFRLGFFPKFGAGILN